MHISDVHDYSPEPAKVVQEFIDQNRKKQIKGVIEELINDEFDRLQEYANEYISHVAADRAEKFLERVLKGDEEAAKQLIGDGGRYRSSGYDQGKPWASLIHGRLFETDGIKLRRQVAEAHADLIRNERIADLESIVEGLSNQIREIERDLERCRS
jgi:hypothetical protein